MEKAILLSVSVFSACLVAGLAAIAAAFGDALAVRKAFEGMTRQPEMAGKIMTIYYFHRFDRIYSYHCYRYRHRTCIY